jgi:hypothetical protein
MEMKAKSEWPIEIIDQWNKYKQEIDEWDAPPSAKHRALERALIMCDHDYMQYHHTAEVVSIDGSPIAPPDLDVKQEIASAYRKIGGLSALADWAEANRTDFFTKLLPKLLDEEVDKSVLVQVVAYNKNEQT